MNGTENLFNLVRNITDLPLIVVNTHGHLDHIYGNAFFDQEIFINEKDISLAKKNYAYPQYTSIKRKNKFKEVKFTPIKEGDIFDLGGIHIEVFEFQGHTAGGILLLDQEDKILFTGDSINRHNWMQLAESLPLEALSDSLKRIEFLQGRYDFILHSHAQDFEPASLYDEYCAAINEILEGKTQADSAYKYWGGTCTQHKYSQGDVIIVYNK